MYKNCLVFNCSFAFVLFKKKLFLTSAEENKAVDAENNSEFSRDSNDEETAKWYQAMRSRGPSLSAMVSRRSGYTLKSSISPERGNYAQELDLPGTINNTYIELGLMVGAKMRG